MSQPLLSGEVGEVEYVNEDRAPEQTELLLAEVRELRGEVYAMKSLLMGQYAAYRRTFGDQAAITPDSSDKWGVIKQRLAPRLREAVDVLLLQGSMKRTHLASALRMDYSNCNKNVIGTLLRQGLLVDNGGNLSLKQL